MNKNEANAIEFGDIGKLVSATVGIVGEPLKKLKLPETFALISALDIFFGFLPKEPSPLSILVKDMEEMKDLMKSVDHKIDAIAKELNVLDQKITQYFKTLSDNLQMIYSLNKFSEDIRYINNSFQDLNSKTALYFSLLNKVPQENTDESYVDTVGKIFEQLYSPTNKKFFEDICILLLNIRQDMGVVPHAEIGVSYYKYLRIFAANGRGSSATIHEAYQMFECKLLYSICMMVYLCSAAIKYQLVKEEAKPGNLCLDNQYSLMETEMLVLKGELDSTIEALRKQRLQNYSTDIPKSFKDEKHKDDYIYLFTLSDKLEGDVICTPVHRINYEQDNMVYSRDVLYLHPGDSFELQCYYKNNPFYPAEWESSNTNSTIVDFKGTVYAAAPGETIITAKSADLKDAYHVTVIVEDVDCGTTSGNSVLLFPKGAAGNIKDISIGEELSLKDLINDSKSTTTGSWKLSSSTYVRLNGDVITANHFDSPGIILVSGHVKTQDTELACHALLRASIKSPSGHVYSMNDFYYDYVTGHADNLILESDLYFTKVHPTWCSKSLNINFDGNGHTVYLSDYPLTPTIEKNGCVKNLITNAEAGAKSPLCPITKINYGQILNIKNYINLCYKNTSAGICITNSGILRDCINYGTIMVIAEERRSASTGGIAVNNIEHGVIENCENHGNILNGVTLGGICTLNSSVIKNCKNMADLNTKHDFAYLYCAVICASIGGQVISCYGTGKVYGQKRYDNYRAFILSRVIMPKIENCSCEAVDENDNKLPLLEKM